MPAHPGEWLTTAEAADMLCISAGRLRGPLIDVAITRRRFTSDPRDGIRWSRVDVERVLHIRQAARLGFEPALRVAASLRRGTMPPQNDATQHGTENSIRACAHSSPG